MSESRRVLAGKAIELLEEGEGPPVVLIHSSGLGPTQWRKLVGRLADTHRVLVPALLGHAGSEPPDDSPTFTQDVAVIEALLDTLPGPVHLVGHSYGGFVSLQVAVRDPARIASLSLCEPVAFGILRSHDGGSGWARMQRELPMDAFFDLGEGLGAWLQRFIDYWNGPGSWDALPEPAKAPFLAHAEAIYGEVHSSSSDMTPHTAYAAIEAPTVLVSGAQTTWAATRICEVLTQTMPTARHVVIEGAGHMAPVIRARAVARVIAEHVAGADQRT